MDARHESCLLLYDDPEPGRWLRAAVVASGATVAGEAPLREALRAAEATKADLVVGIARSADESVVARLRELRRIQDPPIAMFFDALDRDGMAELARGVSNACVLGRPDADRVASVIVIARERHEYERTLRRELDDARASLDERKLIDRAKGLLMDRHGLPEQQAYGKLRSAAMNEGIRIGEVARRLLEFADSGR